MKIAMLGMGEVAKCTLHLIEKFIQVDPHSLYIVERNNETRHRTVNAFIARGAHFLEIELTRENTLQVLRDEIGMQAGDLIIDLTTDMDVFHTVSLCLKHDWLYLNTCIENSADSQLIHYRNHEKMAALIAAHAPPRGQATCIFDHGMNPGLISSFVKKGLDDIAALVLSRRSDSVLQKFLADADYASLAEHLGLEALHLSELDSQTGIDIPPDVFVNTWSCPGFLIEAEAPLQITWGSHEQEIPEGAKVVSHRMLMADIPAWRMKARSYVPQREICGMVIPHEEIVTLRKLLEKPGYSPTICFVYEINPHTERCFAAGVTAAESSKVLTPAENALQGEDKVGALFVLRHNPVTQEAKPWSYWCGSLLETTDPLFSATVIQVAAGVLAAIKWMSANPAAGVLFPEQLPHETILRYAAPYLGEIFSGPVDFAPAGTGFESFLITDSKIPARLLR